MALSYDAKQKNFGNLQKVDDIIDRKSISQLNSRMPAESVNNTQASNPSQRAANKIRNLKHQIVKNQQSTLESGAINPVTSLDSIRGSAQLTASVERYFFKHKFVNKFSERQPAPSQQVRQHLSKIKAVVKPNVPLPLSKFQYGNKEIFNLAELAYSNNSGFQKYTPLPNISENRSISQPRQRFQVQTLKKQPEIKQPTT